MRIIKKLDLFVLKSFTLIFTGSFFICLFVFMMQFLWRYIEDLIGKGLTVDVMAHFFWYMALTLVPQALPLAILLGTLISFGNLGEKFELTAMKAAGVSLLRIMTPLFILSVLLSVASFYFQNVISPKAQSKLTTLLFSIKQSSPVLEIPEGIFYNGVPDVNLYVERKNDQTGMLYGMIIYKTDQGFDQAQIVLADSGKLEMTADQKYLKLTLHSGEQFENLQSEGGLSRLQANAPYDRETFRYKQFLISFDSSFDMSNATSSTGLAMSLNLKELEQSSDSINRECDSVGRSYYQIIKEKYLSNSTLSKKDSLRAVAESAPRAIQIDTVLIHSGSNGQLTALQQALLNTKNIEMELEWKRYNISENDQQVRKFQIQMHQKFTLSLSCFLFFLIGASLGAIIRKGGLGLPTVISVLIFILYYIINTSGMKMAKDGLWNMSAGMWSSTLVLASLGIFLTYKANNDSVVFNLEAYTNFFRSCLGLRPSRHLFRKEVILEDPDYERVVERLSVLSEECKVYNKEKKLYRAPHYIKIFFNYHNDQQVEAFSEQLEANIEELSNSRDGRLLAVLNSYPILFVHAHTSPFHKRWYNVLAGVFVPIGIVLWIRIWRFRIRLLNDLKEVVKTNDKIIQQIKKSQQKIN
ncbi:MAG: LptF/LptG family permease [Bacteroidaceae bacterium]